MRALLPLAVVFLVAIMSISIAGSSDRLACLPGCGGVVDKAPNGVFVVEVAFKNTGNTAGSWSVNVAFEGDSWNWVGGAQVLTLEPCAVRTLTWNGTVPASAPLDSMARLIVYYGDSFVAMNWWIHVVPSAQLSIASSSVR